MEHFEGLIPGWEGTGGSVAGEQRISLASRQFEALLERMAAVVPDTVPRLVNHGHERVHWVEKNGYPCGGNRKVPSDVSTRRKKANIRPMYRQTGRQTDRQMVKQTNRHNYPTQTKRSSLYFSVILYFWLSAFLFWLSSHL